MFESVRVKITLEASEDQPSPSLNLDARARDETGSQQVTAQHHPQRPFGPMSLQVTSAIAK